MRTAKLQLEPLTCPSCVKKIEGALSKREGVHEAKVLFNSSQVKVVFAEDAIDANQLKQTVEQLGYPVSNVKLS